MNNPNLDSSQDFYEPFHFSTANEQEFESLLKFSRDPTTHYFGVQKFKQKCRKGFFEGKILHRLKIHKDETDKTVLGLGEFTSHAPITALPTDCWPYWLKMHFCITYPLSTLNTLFINHFSYSVEVGEQAFRDAISEIFLRENHLSFLIGVEMPNMTYFKKEFIPDYSLLCKHSEVFYPRIFNARQHNVQKIHIMQRDSCLAKMYYRKAVPEDNDDIVEIVDHEHPHLRKNLGDFYVAEELLNEPEGEKRQSSIVCIEVENVISGFVWFNSNVDLQLLATNFEVELFGNLVKFDPNLPYNTLKLSIYRSFRLASEKLFAKEYLQRFLVAKQNSISNKEITSSDLDLITNENEDYFGDLDDEAVERLNKRFAEMRTIFKIFENITSNFLSKRHYIDTNENIVTVRYNVDEENQDIECFSNVFAIQLFGLSKSFDVRRAYRILLSSFCVYPERDYCIISISPEMKLPKTAFEILKYFIPIAPRPGCQITDHLYITHRSTIHGEITVQFAKFEDIEDIERCISPVVVDEEKSQTENAKPSQALLLEIETFKQILMEVLLNYESKFKFLTIRCGNAFKPELNSQVAGFVILRELTETYLLKKQFRLPGNDDFQTAKMEIVALRLHPLYTCLSDDIFRQMAHLTDHWHYFFVLPLQCTKANVSNDLLNYMQPIEPKRIKNSWFMSYDSNADLHSTGNVPCLGTVNFLKDRFALFHNNLLPTKVFSCRTRLIIVGFSEVCKAFLRLMVFFWDSFDSKHANRNTCVPQLEITVIYNPGTMECEYDTDFRCEFCENDKYCYTNREHWNSFIRDSTRRLDLRIVVNFVSGIVKSIDRTNCSIRLVDNCVHYYDKLLLMCGKKYGFPLHLQTGVIPHNYVAMNNRIDKIQLYYKLRAILAANLSSANILIYGPHMAPFDCIDFLLKHGVPPTWITLVVPYIPQDVANELKFNIPHMDTYIENSLQDMLALLDITVIENYNIVGYECFPNQNNIAVVVFEHYVKKTRQTIEADLFINFNEIQITQEMKELCFTSNIHMADNLIIVNENYQTNDENILAIGNYIRFKETPNFQYIYVAPREQAQKIIQFLKINPYIRAKKFGLKFKQNHYFHGLVPNGFQYVKVTRPKRYLRNHLDNEYSRKLVTQKNGFCRIRLDGYGIVEEITAITRKAQNYDFLQFFCGKHESLLNNLQARYCNGLIDCLLEFLQEPWTELLMHDFFYTEVQKPIEAEIMEYVKESFDLNLERSEREKQLKERVPTSNLENILLDCLRKHRNSFDYEFALPEDFPQPFTG